jgi:MarR family 2-MHQ and catechol resistance regulon transcriptional repressor
MKKSAQTYGTESDKQEQHYLNRMRSHSSKYLEFHWSSVELLINLNYTYDVIHFHLERKIGSWGLSPGAFNLLVILSQFVREGCPMHELGELLMVSRANITGLVDWLTRRGLVARIEDKNDRRVRLIQLTKDGEKLLESLLPSYYSIVQEMFKGVSNKDKDQLSDLLIKLRRNSQHSLERYR